MPLVNKEAKVRRKRRQQMLCYKLNHRNYYLCQRRMLNRQVSSLVLKILQKWAMSGTLLSDLSNSTKIAHLNIETRDTKMSILMRKKKCLMVQKSHRV